MNPSKAAIKHKTMQETLGLRLFAYVFFRIKMSSTTRSKIKNTQNNVGSLYANASEMSSAGVSGTNVVKLFTKRPTLIVQKHIHTIFRIMISCPFHYSRHSNPTMTHGEFISAPKSCFLNSFCRKACESPPLSSSKRSCSLQTPQDMALSFPDQPYGQEHLELHSSLPDLKI